MKTALLYLTMLVALATGHDALALGRLADVTIIDRDTGVALATYFHRGEYWVAGRPGGRYAIAIRSRLDRRLLAVTSVDGINVVSGDTAGWQQTGYVFSSGERYEINGWRKSDSEVAAFTFTAVSDSYAARTGRSGNVGVIGVAIFLERIPVQVYAPGNPATSSPSALPAAPASEPLSTMRAEAPEAKAADAAVLGAPPANAAKLGTGHGEREYSYVNHTEFERMQTQPNETIRIRYDSVENLVAMGIVRRGRPAPAAANPFPASPQEFYVPDPPG
jgi:hypothetical protein